MSRPLLDPATWDDIAALITLQDGYMYDRSDRSHMTDMAQIVCEALDALNRKANASAKDVDLPHKPDPAVSVWEAVAVALMGEIAEDGYDPNSVAVLAYNHARNGRYNTALAVLS